MICEGLREAAERHPGTHFACPVHLNPRARTPFFRILSGLPNVSLLPPLDYPSLVWILNKSHFVVTDSGGLQEEAAGLGKPVLVMREWTERPEGVHAGIARLIGTEKDSVFGSIDALLTSEGSYEMMASADSIYGDGKAAPRIAAALVDHSPASSRPGGRPYGGDVRLARDGPADTKVPKRQPRRGHRA